MQVTYQCRFISTGLKPVLGLYTASPSVFMGFKYNELLMELIRPLLAGLQLGVISPTSPPPSRSRTTLFPTPTRRGERKGEREKERGAPPPSPSPIRTRGGGACGLP